MFKIKDMPMYLYPGSDRPIKHPEIRDNNRYLDFGVGFLQATKIKHYDGPPGYR